MKSKRCKKKRLRRKKSKRFNAGNNSTEYVLMDDNRTLASYGIVGSSEYDDIYTLQMVVVTPLTPEQIKARQQEVYDAAEAGETTRLQTAIQAAKDGGADLNWQNRYGWTPVWIAAAIGRDGCLSQLIAAGADVDIKSNQGTTPIYITASYGRDGCLSQLIAAGADVNISDEHGRTPVYSAAFNGNDECLSQLITAGADVNIADNGGETPLQEATRYHRAYSVELLKAAGAT